MDDIEEIKEKKKEELMKKEEEESVKDDKRNFLTEDARRRLKNFKMANPELGEQIERDLLEMYHSGNIREMLDEEDMKKLLRGAKEETRVDYDIKRR